MTYIVLDIGAGQTFFAKRLRKRNPTIPILVLCGEPDWSRERHFFPFRVTPDEKIPNLIEAGKTGIHRIQACYEDFNLPDNSLDLVTLNCPHPLIGPSVKMIDELERCLKPGGLFFSSHVLIDAGRYPKSFELIAAGSWGWEIGTAIDVSTGPLPEDVVRVFPKSWNMVSNIIKARGRHLYFPFTTDGIYSGRISPRWKLLQKPA